MTILTTTLIDDNFKTIIKASGAGKVSAVGSPRS
jgi:hypothetical protein